MTTHTQQTEIQISSASNAAAGTSPCNRSASATASASAVNGRANIGLGLRTRMLVVLLALGLTLGLGMWWLMRDNIQTSFAKLESDDAVENATRTSNLIAERCKQLSQQAADWGAWDDSYAFIEDLNDKYTTDNFTADAFARIGVQHVLYLDARAGVCASFGINLSSKDVTTVPPELLERDWSDISLAASALETKHAGVVMIAGKPMLLGAGQILKGDGSGPVRGTIITLRSLDERELKSLSGALGFPVTLAPARSTDGAMRSEIQSDAELAAVFPLTDLFGQVQSEGRCALDRDIMAQGRATLRGATVNIATMAAAFSLVVFIVMGRLVIGRLVRMSEEVSSLATDGTASGRVSIGGGDEIGVLASRFNAMLGSVESSHQRLNAQNKDLAIAKAAADAANDAKTRFLASMSHEIRTPLNGIIGFADLLMRKADDGEEAQRAEWVGVIHGSSTHLLSLLNDVLDLSKMDVGKMDIAPAPCSPRAAVSESVLIMQSRAQEKGIALGVKFEPNVPEAIRTDGTRLRQIIMNLVGNAVKFTEQGRVDVGVAFMPSPAPCTPAALRVTIADTGIGMTPEQESCLFNPFQQADATISNRFGGTGLGLAISKGLAKRLGGDITVTSTPGAGSVFTLTIEAAPLLPGEFLPRTLPTVQAWDSGKPGAAAPLAGRTILVVDDVETNRKVCSIFLGRAGATTVLACDGQEAVEICRTKNFDLVLMDIQMPVMNGNDATKALRAAGLRVPILALTAFSSGADRDDCLAAGMNDFLAKPIEPAVMIQSAVRWIRESQRPTEPDRAESDLPTWESDPELEAVARGWLAELPARLDEIDAALVAGDIEAAARGAHAIKGSGGSLGCSEFTEPAAALESAARAKSIDIAWMALSQLRQMCKAASARPQSRAA